ncbi:MAG TPA: hypothetical protein VFV38_07085 [Ktedonobacteraceae bacterium]|nr:hypothetical protein [Ktedonobacteraceae bacterium]
MRSAEAHALASILTCLCPMQRAASAERSKLMKAAATSQRQRYRVAREPGAHRHAG